MPDEAMEGLRKMQKSNLEMMDVLLEIADDLDHGCQMSEYSKKEDKNWLRKYVHMRR